MLMKWKSLFAAALSAAVTLPAWAQDATGGGIASAPLSISVNVIGGDNPNSTWTALTSIKDTEGQSGLADYRVDNANWNELTQQNSGNTGGTPETLTALVDNTGAATVATVTARLGGWWHLTSAETVRTNAVGYMGVGFCDPSKVEGTNELTIANVPYTEYSLILYYGTNNKDNKWAAPKVTFADDSSKTYTYAADATGAATEGSAAWGSTTATTDATQAGTLGKDVMLIKGLSGDISIDLGTQPDTGAATQAGSLCGFQIVCTGKVIEELIDPAKKGVISLNFGSDQRAVPENATTYGLVPVAGNKWQNFSGASGTEDSVMTAENVDLTSTPMTVTYSAFGMWKNEEATDPFMYGYLDDGDAISGVSDNVAVSVDVAGVGEAFDVYDVIVYLSTDEDFYTFFPVQVNGSYYRWDDTFKTTVKTTVATPDTSEAAAFGQGKQAATKYGVNAIRVTAQTGPLALRTLPRLWDGNVGRSQRGCLAAIQVVERKVIEVNTADFDLAGALTAYAEGTPLLVKVASGATIAGDVTLPADAILDLSAYTFGDTLPINGTLTMNGGTIRLPAGFDSAKIAASISGSFKCLLGDEPVWLSNQDGTLSLSYEWWGLGGDDLWSNPLNWSSGRVPNKNAEVSFNLGASDEIVILDKAATVASVTITGSESGDATLALTSAEGATGSLTVSGRMLATGNVTVTQSSDITVQGTTEMYSTGVGYPEQPCQAGFHVHQGTWKILSGTLSVPTDGGTNDGGTITGEAGISGGGTLIVGGEGASNATLAVWQIRPIMYGQAFTSANGTLRVAAGGTLTASQAVSLAVNYGHTYTVDLAGGTLEGVTVSDDSSLRAPNGGTLNVTLPRGSSGDALTGEGDVTLSGTVTIPSELTDYTGTLTVSAGSALTLSAPGARPNLVLEDGVAEDKKTALTVTPSTEEAALGEIVFPTAMKAVPANVDYTVAGKEVTATVADGTLKLSWKVDYPTLAQTGNWSAAEKWTSATVPDVGVAILDGTSAPITVMLDTALTGMTSIVVRGDVSLETTKNQATIPACVTLAEGATLGVGATSFGDTWALPAGTTLRIEDAGFSLANIQTVNSYTQFAGNVEIDFSDGSIGDSAENPIRIDGTLSIKGNNVTFTNLGLLAGDVDLLGNNIWLDRERDQEGGTTSGALGIGSDGTTILTNRGNGNRIVHATRLNGTIDVQSGSLALLTEQPRDISTTSSAYHATIAEGATLILEEDCAGGQYPATGAGTYAVGTNRPQFAAVGVATTTPAIITATATAEEQSAGTITFANYQSAVSFPEGFEAKIKPYGAAAPWVTVAKAGGNTLRILNVPAPNGLTGLDDAVALTLRQAAAKEGITNGNYTVQLRTKGGQTTIASPDAATLNDVLGCFTGLTATADGTTLTYAYDFGIVGIKRNTTGDGWVVTAKVQGANAEAGFAKGGCLRDRRRERHGDVHGAGCLGGGRDLHAGREGEPSRAAPGAVSLAPTPKRAAFGRLFFWREDAKGAGAPAARFFSAKTQRVRAIRRGRSPPSTRPFSTYGKIGSLEAWRLGSLDRVSLVAPSGARLYLVNLLNLLCVAGAFAGRGRSRNP